MKNIGFIAYLCIALLATCAMVVLGFLTGNEVVPDAKLDFRTRDYEPVEASSIHLAENTVWSPPAPQQHGENWLFGVFTPPKIYKHPKTGEFTAVPYIEEKPPEVKPEIPKPPFGIAFTALYREPFRVAVQSVIASPQGSFIQMEVREFEPPTPGVSAHKLLSKRALNAAPGEVNNQEKLRIDGIETRVIRDANGNETTIYLVNVTDFIDQQKYKLEQGGKQAMTSYFWVTLQSTSTPSIPPIFLKNPAAGTHFKINGADYVIAALKAGPVLSITKKYMHVSKEAEDPEEVVETREIPLGAAAAVAPVPGSPLTPPTLPSVPPSPPVPGVPPVPSSPTIPSALPGVPPVPASVPPVPPAVPTAPPFPGAPPAPRL